MTERLFPQPKSESEEQFHLAPLIDILFLVVLLYAVTSAFIGSTRIIELEQTLSRLSSEKQSLEEQVTTQQQDLAQLNTKLEAAQTTITQLNQSLAEAERQHQSVEESNDAETTSP